MRYAIPTFRVDVRHHEASCTMSVGGELDVGSSPLLQAVATDALHTGHVVVSLDRLEFIDVAGVRCLQAVLDHGRWHGTRVHLVGPSVRTQQVMRLAGMAHLVEGSDFTPGGISVGPSDV